MNTAICDAIEKRETIAFHYDGGNRTTEPHCHGASQAGHELLRAYQTGGFSRSGNSEGWKMFSVNGMSGVVGTGGTFPNDRPHYNPNDSRMVRICCCV